MIELANEIKIQRASLCFTQEELAQLSKVNIRTIQRAEKGIKIGPYTLRCMLGALNLDVLATIKKFEIKEIQAPEFDSITEIKEFNPDRWFAEFQIRKAKHKLWGIDIHEKSKRLKIQKEHDENDVPFDMLDAELEELDCAYIFYEQEGEELINEEAAIDSFDWESWEMQKEIEALAKEQDEEEQEIRKRADFLGNKGWPE